MGIETGRNRISESQEERGTSLILAVLALVLLTGMGVALLFITRGETRSGQVDQRVKRVFYGSEAALEHGREELRQWNIGSGTIEVDDELTQAAGLNGILEFDPDTAEPIFDAGGNLSGFTNTGDDLPLKGLTAYEGGMYMAYLTNDPADGRTAIADSNKMLAVTGLGVTDEGSFEKVEAVVNAFDAFPRPSAAITILGPNPMFEGGSSTAKLLTGNDCGQYWFIPGLTIVPVVGVIGAAAEAQAELGITKPDSFQEGNTYGVQAIDDIESTIDPRWKDCEQLVELAARFKSLADVVGNTATPLAQIGTVANPKMVFIEGDYVIPGGFVGAGALWVTGKLDFHGNASFQGPIFIIGRGDFERSGSGNGDISGGNIVANVSGADGVLFTSDDCHGADGVSGTSDDGIGPGAWNVSGGGSGDTVYCTSHLNIFAINWPFDIVEFRQR
ncbi:MAG: hypothetical protein OEQ13_00540 [Acidobacteriota bacterium]|nr:hypothetical protein [Acidobacteriota bacterium]